MKDLKGICVALSTPFTDDGENVDESALRNHIDDMLESGVHIILVCGGTGEFAYLRPEERRKIAEIVCKTSEVELFLKLKFLPFTMIQVPALQTKQLIDYTLLNHEQPRDSTHFILLHTTMSRLISLRRLAGWFVSKIDIAKTPVMSPPAL